MLYTIPDAALIGNVFSLASRAIGEVTNIPANVSTVQTGGYSVAGDGGGASFVRDAGPLADGASFQSDDGAWWLLVTDNANPLMFGAIGDGITNDTAHVQNMFDFDCENFNWAEKTYAVVPVAVSAIIVDGKNVNISGIGGVSMASLGNFSALRFTNCPSLKINGGTYIGSNTNGANGGQGLIQTFQCQNVVIENTLVKDANCDGIAVAVSTSAYLMNNRSENCAKSALYVNNTTSGGIIGNSVYAFGGHTVGGNIVGVGIQSSGNADFVISDNSIVSGTGIGILVDDNLATCKRNVVANNSVYDCRNATNINVSCGIRLQNANVDKGTATFVGGNVVQRCGIYNYYIENHNGFTLRNNVGIESDQTNFMIAFNDGGIVQNNTAINTGTINTPNEYAFHLINACTHITGDGNKAYTNISFNAPFGSNTINDTTGLATNHVVKMVEYEYTEATAAWQPNAGANIATGTSISQNFAGIPAAVVGAYVEVAAPYTLNDCIASAYVALAGTVRVTLFNCSGANRAFANGNWNFRIFSPNQ